VIPSGFKSKKIRVNLNQPIKAEVKAETSDVMKSVDEDRKYVIQATIVRFVRHCYVSPS
jgi:cullin 1